jgi:hypothetical protein
MNRGRLGRFRWAIPLIVFLVVLNLTLVPYSYCHAEDKTTTGDVDGDGQVTLQDMDKVLDIINSQDYQPTADLNGDGKVDINDLDIVEEAYRKSPAVRASEQ